MSEHTLIIGGARSGKTTFAERLAMRAGQSPVYMATAEALDDEMRTRVETHQRQREGRFVTVEEPLDVPEAIEAASISHDVILVDCLTLWITNLLGAERDVTEAVEDLADALEALNGTQVLLVTNEVGLGVVPETALGRTFRDLAGWTHQRLGASCTNVFFMTAGLPMALKGKLPRLD